jgi:hypothetical protein
MSSRLLGIPTGDQLLASAHVAVVPTHVFAKGTMSEAKAKYSPFPNSLKLSAELDSIVPLV